MKIFGFEINVKKSTKEESKSLEEIISRMDRHDVEDVVKQLKNSSLFNGGFIDPAVIVERTQNDFIRKIKWPRCDHLDEFGMVSYNKARQDLLKAASSYGGGHFSICTLNELRDLGCFEVKGPKKDAYEKLRKLHCVDFKHMSPEIKTKLVELINFIFSGNEDDIIEGDFSVEEQKLLTNE